MTRECGRLTGAEQAAPKCPLDFDFLFLRPVNAVDGVQGVAFNVPKAAADEQYWALAAGALCPIADVPNVADESRTAVWAWRRGLNLCRPTDLRSGLRA